MLLIPGMGEAHHAFQRFSILFVCNVACSRTYLAEDCLSLYLEPHRTRAFYVSNVDLAAVPGTMLT